jgi:hypothetical protein
MSIAADLAQALVLTAKIAPQVTTVPVEFVPVVFAVCIEKKP